MASHIVQCAGWALYGRELRGDIVIEGSGPAGYAVRLMGGFRERKGRMPIEGDKIEVHYMMNRYLSLNISASDYAELSRKYMGHGAGTKGHYKMYVVSEFAIKVIV